MCKQVWSKFQRTELPLYTVTLRRESHAHFVSEGKMSTSGHLTPWSHFCREGALRCHPVIIRRLFSHRHPVAVTHSVTSSVGHPPRAVVPLCLLPPDVASVQFHPATTSHPRRDHLTFDEVRHKSKAFSAFNQYHSICCQFDPHESTEDH